MKLKPLWICGTGLALGGGVAWLGAKYFPHAPMPTEAARTTSGNVVGARHAEADESAGMASWKRIQAYGLTGMDRRLAMLDLVAKADSRTIRKLLAATPRDDFYARELLLRRWVEIDGEAAGTWAAELMRDPSRTNYKDKEQATLVFSLQAAKDPAAVMGRLQKAASGHDAASTSYEILKRLQDTDMAAAIAFGALTPDSNAVMHWSMTREKDRKWLEKDPVRAAALLGALPPGEFRDINLCGVIGVLAEKDFSAAVALHRKFPALRMGRYDNDPRAAFYTQWAKTDPAGMTAFINDEALGPARLVMKETLAKALGESDPATALPWATENLSGASRTKAVEEILPQLVKSNPGAALDYLNSLPSGVALNSAAAAFVKGLPEGDFASAFVQAESLPEGPARSRLAQEGYKMWFGKAPEAALQQLLTLPPQDRPGELWRELGGRSPNMEEGLKLTSSLPEGAAEEFTKGLWKERMPEFNPGDIDQFYNRLPAGNQQLAALEVIAKSRAWSAPQQLVEWAATLSSAGEREAVATNLSTLLQALPQHERDQLLAPLRK